MTIGIPILDDRVSPVLDAATHVLLVTRRRGREVRRRECVLQPQPPEGMARTIAAMGVQVLLCAALSELLHQALQREQVRVRSHVCGEVEAVLQAFCARQLGRAEFRMPGCQGRHVGGRCGRRPTLRTL